MKNNKYKILNKNITTTNKNEANKKKEEKESAADNLDAPKYLSQPEKEKKLGGINKTTK